MEDQAPLDPDALAADHPRDSPRDSMFLQATVRLQSTGQVVAVRVRNVSAGGLMAEGEVEVRNDQKLWIELRNIGQVSGTVAWVRNNRFGVSFDAPIDPALTRVKVPTPTVMSAPAYETKRRPGFSRS